MIVLDVDDTTLLTWNYEIFSNWAFNPTTNASFVTNEQFPAVFGMVNMVKAAEREGYAIIFLTGRPATQEQATLGNLTNSDDIGIDAGYPKPTTLSDGEDGLFTNNRLSRTTPLTWWRRVPATRTAPARPSTTRRRHARTSSRSATTSSRTSATSSVTSRVASRTRRSSCRTRTTSSVTPLAGRLSPGGRPANG